MDRHGQITVPRAGPLTVAGVRSDQLEARLKTHIARVFKNFELNATLGRLRSIQVFVVGQARKPGVFTTSSVSTLISVLFESGGPAATGSMRQIRLVRGEKQSLRWTCTNLSTAVTPVPMCAFCPAM